MDRESLGIIGYDSFHFAVENLDRSRAFYTGKLDFAEVARAGDELVQKSGQASSVFAAGDVRVCVSTPLHQDCKAARYLRRHPDGVMSLSFRVEDLDRAQRILDHRGASFLADPFEVVSESGGRYRAFEIATPLGDVAFRYVERSDFPAFAPGFVSLDLGAPREGRFGIQLIDHVTSNALTMQPIVGFYRDILGMQEFWNIRFHTSELLAANAGRGSLPPEDPLSHRHAEPPHGTGLRSIVMWDPEGDIKFATNEPLRPYFRESQIARFCYDNAGPGIQHLALGVPDILAAVEEMRARAVTFLSTPKRYYDLLPRRLAALGISNVKERISDLERLEILLDGADDKYMLQIFLREAASLYEDERAGPFFYELIQRAGDPGFGYGNFRALFESIERVQTTAPAG